MKKNVFYLTIVSFFTCFLIWMILDPMLTITTSKEALLLFREKLFPSLFPFLVLGECLIFLGIPSYLSYVLGKPFQALFHLNGKASFLVLMSMFSGFPSGPKYTKRLYEEKEITKKEAEEILELVHFSNPLFVLGTVFLILKSKKITNIVLFSHILSNFLMAFLERKKRGIKKETTKHFLFLFHEKTKSLDSFGIHFLEAIQSSIQTMLFMLGSITFFMLFAKLLTSSIKTPLIKCFLTGVLDLTSGIFSLQTKEISLPLKGLLATFFLTFGSCSVHLQVLNALKETDLSYSSFLKGRLKATLLSILCFLFLTIING